MCKNSSCRKKCVRIHNLNINAPIIGAGLSLLLGILIGKYIDLKHIKK